MAIPALRMAQESSERAGRVSGAPLADTWLALPPWSCPRDRAWRDPPAQRGAACVREGLSRKEEKEEASFFPCTREGGSTHAPTAGMLKSAAWGD
jgi:hypothetical protein